MGLFSAGSRRGDAAEPALSDPPPGDWLAWRVSGGAGTVPAACSGLSLVGAEVALAPAGTRMQVRAEGRLWWLRQRPLNLRVAPQPGSPALGLSLDLSPWRADGLPFDQDALAARLATLDAEAIAAPQLEGLLRQMPTAWNLLTLPPCAQAGEVDAARDALNAIILHALGLKCQALFRVDPADAVTPAVQSAEMEHALGRHLADLPRNEAHAEARCFLELPRLSKALAGAALADPRLEPRLAGVRDRLRRLINTRTGRRPQLAATAGANGVDATDQLRARSRASLRAADALDNLWLTLHSVQGESGGTLAARHLGAIEAALTDLSAALDCRFGVAPMSATPAPVDPAPPRRGAPADLPTACSAFALLPGGVRVSVRAEANADRTLDLSVISASRSVQPLVKQALQSARAAEANLGAEFGVVLTLDADAAANPLHSALVAQVMPLLAVVADRALRGLWSASHTLVLGTGQGDWASGTLQGFESPEVQRAALAAAVAAGDLGPIRLVWPPSASAEEEALRQQVRERHPAIDYWQVERLSALVEHDGAGAGLRMATVHFPVVGDAEGSLVAVSVKLLPAAVDYTRVAGSVPNGGRDREAIVRLLAALRARDNPGGEHWRTVVSFEAGRPVVDRSYQLALVLADRIARGREFRMPQGKRLIATGEVAFPDALQDHHVNAGAVSLAEDADAIERKGAVLLREAKAGERVLLPGNWAGRCAPWRAALKDKDIASALVDAL